MAMPPAVTAWENVCHPLRRAQEPHATNARPARSPISTLTGSVMNPRSIPYLKPKPAPMSIASAPPRANQVPASLASSGGVRWGRSGRPGVPPNG